MCVCDEKKSQCGAYFKLQVVCVCASICVIIRSPVEVGIVRRVVRPGGGKEPVRCMFQKSMQNDEQWVC